MSGTFNDKPNNTFQMAFNPNTFEISTFKYAFSQTDALGYVDEETINLTNISAKYFVKTETANYITYSWAAQGSDLLASINEARKRFTGKDSYGSYDESTGKIANNKIGFTPK